VGGEGAGIGLLLKQTGTEYEKNPKEKTREGGRQITIRGEDRNAKKKQGRDGNAVEELKEEQKK